MGSQAQLRDHELPDYTYRGPFGGFQSEMPLDMIETLGFASVNNLLFRKGMAQSRPALGVLPFPPQPFEPWVGVMDFFDVRGGRHQLAMTPTRVFTWDGNAQSWVVLPGDGITGPSGALFTSAVVGGSLFFANGVDRVKVWDGFQPGYTDAGSFALPAKYVMELDNRLLAAYTTEGTPPALAVQRLHWSAPGNGGDWKTAFVTGQTDLFNDLGPITGLVKLGQAGYAFQQWGITQIQLTGNGLQPFVFLPSSSHSKGCIAPYSLAAFGENICCYIGKDNIYLFDGNTSEPIGDSPIDGRGTRVGARTAIFADLIAADLSRVFGFYSTSINGVDFNAYWIFIPGGSTWVFHMDENNWTRLSWQDVPTVAGTFIKSDQVLINQLVGTIEQQGWTPLSFNTTNPLDQMFLGFDSGIPGYIDFSGACDQDYGLSSGQCSFGDLRHEKVITRFRLTVRDLMEVTYTLRVENERKEVVVKDLTMGSGTGRIIHGTFEPKIGGQYLTWSITCPAGTQTHFVEFKPLYSMGGEVR